MRRSAHHRTEVPERTPARWSSLLVSVRTDQIVVAHDPAALSAGVRCRVDLITCRDWIRLKLPLKKPESAAAPSDATLLVAGSLHEPASSSVVRAHCLPNTCRADAPRTLSPDAQKGFERSEVCPELEQVRGERPTQQVRMHAPSDSSCPRAAANGFRNADARHWLPGARPGNSHGPTERHDRRARGSRSVRTAAVARCGSWLLGHGSTRAVDRHRSRAARVTPRFAGAVQEQEYRAMVAESRRLHLAGTKHGGRWASRFSDAADTCHDLRAPPLAAW
jgi:hypothetical protein